MKMTLPFALLMCVAMPAFAGNDTTQAEMNNAEMHNEQTSGTQGTETTTTTTTAPHHMGKMHDMHMKHDAMFSKVDTDNDGRISQKEWMAFAAKKWQMADANGDGYVTREELAAAHKKEWQEMKAEETK